MTGLVADVVTLVILCEGEIYEVIVRWSEPAIEQALLAWAEKEFDLTLPEDHEEALGMVHDHIASTLGMYKYEIWDCRIQEF